MRCTEERRDTPHRPYYNGFFEFKNERVFTCRKCGAIRTENYREIPEGEIRNKKFGEQLKKMRRHGFPENYTPPYERDEK